jgi:hypothetical protein
MAKIFSFIKTILDKSENITLRLVELEYSSKHGHEICIMQLIGKNIFPKLTAEEILSNRNIMTGLPPEDIIFITRLDSKIQERKRGMKVLEVDRNGTIVLVSSDGKIKRYSEKKISKDLEMISKMNSIDAYALGYRVGFKEGINLKEKLQ